MLIESITLNNFRQYYQEQVIELSSSTTRNITVIHGENGSGKTALLNAFSWCLYGILNLPNEKNIINEHAISCANNGEKIEGSVTIKFEDQDRKYQIMRKVTAEKDISGRLIYHEPEVSVDYKDIHGLFHAVNNPTNELNLILPEDLRTYFFFDGERIDNLSKDSGSEDVKKAIKNIMGLEILERGIDHTSKARVKFRNELKNYSDRKTVDLIEELTKLESEKDKLKEEEDLHKESLKLTDKHVREVEEKLKQIEGAKQLQEQRDTLESKLKENNNNITNIHKKLKDNMSKDGHLAFSFPLTDQAQKILKEHDDSINPSGVSSHLIDEIISNGFCICGQKLTSDTEHLEHLIKLKEIVGEKHSRSKVFDLIGDIKVIKERKDRLINELKSLKSEEIKLHQNTKRLREEIDEISEQLSGKETEEIVELEAKRNKLVEQKSHLDRKIGATVHERNKIEEIIKEKEKTRKKYQSLEAKGLLTQKRIEACEQLEYVMAEILKVREKMVRSQLQDKITEVYEQFLRKDYQIRLTENYELKVLNDNNNVVGMSQGERQITSLSFIGAIVDIAREQYKKENKQEFDKGGIFPLVMDSPFGALDSDHRERIAKGIHKLADQVIVIVSTSQWKGEVQEQMINLIGKEYKLQYNDPRQNKDKPYEFTEVIEVKET
ncbi:AAA family ATPase [Alkalihalophilus pseudofirmus]|uniref:Nuclease SbcCD subunit C n=1 Tax=Alkalihalophilus pseudofirmus TaxID=79885 RepID=A0AAJ2KX37_ALKPS|nr:AAA family ATPase [Alkalihalophilus pseudofirmus]MDV2884680.1 AAA family ATPase [Alkalihalophilus pseudofirmus]